MAAIDLIQRSCRQHDTPTACARHTIWQQTGLALCAALFLFGSACASDTVEASDPSALELYQKAQYTQAAVRGLTELLREPWNHSLRFLVADSLQRSGKFDDAKTQFQALEGTPYAASAALRLNALGSVERAPKLPPPAAPGPTVARQIVAQAQDQPIISEPKPVVQALVPRAAVASPARSLTQHHFYDMYNAEDYKAVSTEGLALLTRETPDDGLRLIIANSLAWTGQLKEAGQQYQALLKGDVSKDANVGLANVYRWSGREDQALPLLRSVLNVDPNHAGAKEGLELVQRELRPRTLISMGRANDSSDMQRASLTASHRWRDRSGSHIFEVETGGVNDVMPGTDVNQRDLTVRYQTLRLPLQPRIELSAQASPESTIFGGLRLKLLESPLFLDVGRVNWGRLASNALALQANLTAAHVGAEMSGDLSSFGRLGGRVDYYDISDSNAVLSSNFSFTPAWRPLGLRIKPLIGMETRDARTASAAYWSPASGFGTVYAGLLGEWSGANWDFFASSQAGARLYGEAGPNWSISAGGRHWLGKDLALGLNLWNMSSWRNSASYRAKTLALSLEKVWN
jgi:tetratricopeptide (TPR) repeat protein